MATVMMEMGRFELDSLGNSRVLQSMSDFPMRHLSEIVRSGLEDDKWQIIVALF
jgi:hypothetical protein